MGASAPAQLNLLLRTDSEAEPENADFPLMRSNLGGPQCEDASSPSSVVCDSDYSSHEEFGHRLSYTHHDPPYF